MDDAEANEGNNNTNEVKEKRNLEDDPCKKVSGASCVDINLCSDEGLWRPGNVLYYKGWCKRKRHTMDLDKIYLMKLSYGDLVKGSSQHLLLLHLPQKMTLTSKVTQK